MHADQRTAGYKIGLFVRDQFFIWDTVMYSQMCARERTKVYRRGRCVEVCIRQGWWRALFYYEPAHLRVGFCAYEVACLSEPERCGPGAGLG